MKSLLRNLTLAATLFTAGSAFADSHGGMHDMQQGAVQIQHAYARAVPPGQSNSAAFMTLHNQSDTANALISASSPVSRVAELHTHTMDGGMMKMRKIEKIDLPAKGEAVLKPGGLHIMLIGLKEQLKPGMKVELTLNFADGSQSMISMPVQQVMQSMGHKMGDHKPMQH